MSSSEGMRALTGEEWYILDAYYRHMVARYHTKVIAQPLEQVVRDEGLNKVVPGGHATMAARLAAHGYLVKMDKDGPVEYRLTQMGEREAAFREREHLNRLLYNRQAEIEVLTDTIKRLEQTPEPRPWWKFWSVASG